MTSDTLDLCRRVHDIMTHPNEMMEGDYLLTILKRIAETHDESKNDIDMLLREWDGQTDPITINSVLGIFFNFMDWCEKQFPDSDYVKDSG